MICSSHACLVFRERLKNKLSFDNYKEKFSLLLHVEELQMQKDIRNYDMKGVVFQQERGDRRFLILEVGGCSSANQEHMLYQKPFLFPEITPMPGEAIFPRLFSIYS